jgi:hypothetical protein
MHHKRNRKPAMSTPFYDLASLVVVPSGYKSGKIYAQKPLTTDGQLTFTRASTATRVNASGLIETVSSGVPRLDYLNSTCPRLLLEPQRTNIYTYSEQFDNAAWNKQSVTVSANAGTSPDGTANADKVIPSTSTAFQALYFGATTATSFTYGVFAKAAGYNYIVLLDQFSSVFTNVVFNLSAGTCSAGGKIENYGNGWYRCSVSAVNAGAATAIPTYAVSPDGTNVAFAGNGTSGVLLWGAQFESGAAYATSYIPTTSAAVTRLADAASKTGISSLIGQTEGTLYWEGSGNATVGGADLWMAEISVNDTNVAVLVYYYAAAGTVNVFINNGTTSVSLAAPMTLTQNNKVAVAYKNASFALYLNGALVDSSSSAIAPPTAMNQFAFVKWVGVANQERMLVNQALLFKTRLTNAQLAELTTL